MTHPGNSYSRRRISRVWNSRSSLVDIGLLRGKIGLGLHGLSSELRIRHDRPDGRAIGTDGDIVALLASQACPILVDNVAGRREQQRTLDVSAMPDVEEVVFAHAGPLVEPAIAVATPV